MTEHIISFIFFFPEKRGVLGSRVFFLAKFGGGREHREGNAQHIGTPFHSAYSTMQCVRVCLRLWCDVFILSSGSERSELAIIFIYGSNCKPAHSIYTGCPKIAKLSFNHRLLNVRVGFREDLTWFTIVNIFTMVQCTVFKEDEISGIKEIGCRRNISLDLNKYLNKR